MKGNDGSGNIESRDDWETPQKLFNTINEQYNFTLDCCATKENKKCISFCRAFELSAPDERHIAWINPPFSKAREMFTHFFKVVKKGVAIYRCDNLETALWQEIIFPNADWILIPKGRISYEGKEGKGSRFPSALIGIGLEPPKNIKGHILKIVR